MNKIVNADWHGCYDDSWKGYIVDEAFAHPAKFSRGLIERIYKYMLAEGMLRRGETVVDPFGGIGSGGVIAASNGLRWIGCELEQKFVDMATQNFTLHLVAWAQFADPIPMMVCGDSRRLRENLRGVLADAVCCSPPFSGVAQGTSGSFKDMAAAWQADPKNAGKPGYRPNQTGDYQRPSFADDYGATPGQLGSMPTGSVDSIVSSPPYAETAVAKSSNGVDLQKQYATYRSQGGGASFEAFTATQAKHSGDYGYSAGQLGNLKAGEVSAVVSSPPYAESATDGARPNRAANLDAAGIDSKAWLGERRCTQGRSEGYGESPGQLAALPAGVVDSVVSSPPYEGSFAGESTDDPAGSHGRKDGSGRYSAGRLPPRRYSENPDNLGEQIGETFWSAARDIVRECHAILKPSGYTAFVVKAFVRDKQIVDFPGDWQKLCEA